MLYILCGVCSGGSHSSQSVDFVLHRYIFYLVWIRHCYIFYVVCAAEAHSRANQWIAYFTSTENRHALPLFTSLLNVVCAYDPVGYGMPYNHLMFTDTREPLVEVALHVLCATLEGSEPAVAPSDVIAGTANVKPANEVHENESRSLQKYYYFSATNIFTLTFRSLSETFIRRSLFNSSSGSCQDSDATWQEISRTCGSACIASLVPVQRLPSFFLNMYCL